MEEVGKIAGIPPWVAAKIMKKSVDFVRWGLQQERFPFGWAVKSQGKKERWNYYISPKMFAEHLGIEGPELDALMQQVIPAQKGV